MRIVLASNNPGKLREFNALFLHLSAEVIPQATFNIPEIPETGFTFIENALIKARHASKLAKLPAIADDSGLVVPALHGAPGIFSARYAGSSRDASKNIQKLLFDMRHLTGEKRHAYFYCILVYMQDEHDPAPLVSEGRWAGTICSASCGNKGFGYDPIFYSSLYQKTAAELPLNIKNTISHRGKALQSLLKKLTDNA